MLVRKKRENSRQNSELQSPYLFSNNEKHTPSQLKSYYTSRQEQDDCSICPSIEKELNEVIDIVEPNDLTEISLKELIEQNKLKDKALEKASAMIRLLSEENQELLNQVGYLETIIKDRDRQIESFEEEFKTNGPHTIIKDIFNDRQTLSKPPPRTILMNNEFYTFAQQKESKSQVRRSQSKIVNNDHPSFKELNLELNVSKKLTPYTSKQQQTEIGVGMGSVLANLSLLLVREGVGSSRAILQEINQLIAVEQQEQEELLLEFGLYEADFQSELPHSPESSQISRRLFTLEKGKQKDGDGLIGVIQGYQQCIQGYREYSAYLRAHLCECINFLSQQHFTTRTPDTSWLPPFVKLAAKDIGRNLKNRIREVEQENWELKKIMEELIHNFSATQPTLSSTRKNPD